MTGEIQSLPPWAALAMRSPIGFAQVREDALIDLAVLDRIGKRSTRVMMIASGGCTAAALAASNSVQLLHLVDANPAQMALCRLKLQLLRDESPDERCKLLGHNKMPAKKRAKSLADYLDASGLPLNSLGELSSVAEIGPDYSGKYEIVFSHLRAAMHKFAGEWETLLNPMEDEILPLEILESHVPGMYWAPPASGFSITDDDAAKIESLWQDQLRHASTILYPDEAGTSGELVEGSTREVLVNVYERNPAARAACIAHYGIRCLACDLDFEERYGTIGEGFIHVHHLKCLAEIGAEYVVHPVRDLRPVCPNCHAMIHQQDPPLSTEQLKRRLLAQR